MKNNTDAGLVHHSSSTLTPGVPLNQSNVSQYTRKLFGFQQIVRSKLRQCGNLREDARENVGAQTFVLDTWNYLLAS